MRYVDQSNAKQKTGQHQPRRHERTENPWGNQKGAKNNYRQDPQKTRRKQEEQGKKKKQQMKEEAIEKEQEYERKCPKTKHG